MYGEKMWKSASALIGLIVLASCLQPAGVSSAIETVETETTAQLPELIAITLGFIGAVVGCLVVGAIATLPGDLIAIVGGALGTLAGGVPGLVLGILGAVLSLVLGTIGSIIGLVLGGYGGYAIGYILMGQEPIPLGELFGELTKGFEG